MQFVHLNAETENLPESTPRLVSLLPSPGIGKDKQEKLSVGFNPLDSLLSASECPAPPEGDEEARGQVEQLPPTGKKLPAGPPCTLD